MAEKQIIEGGSLLSSIVALFFKGLDNILDSAAEYEEEMGVLKQVNHIALQDEDGKQYELTIKLAPVRDKKGIYYVEASTDKPGFDVSSMNDIAVRLNNQTMKEFNAKVNELIEKNKLTVVKEEEKSDEETLDEHTVGEPLTDRQVQLLISEVQKKFKPTYVRWIAGEKKLEPPQLVTGTLKVELNGDADNQVCQVTISVTIDETKYGLSIEPDNTSTPLADVEVMVKNIKLILNKYMQLNDLEEYDPNESADSSNPTNSSKIVDATLKKVTGSTELTLMAINASCNIKAALDMLTDVVDDEEFINSFADDEERSIEITDLGDNYDVEEIDEVDITPTYNVLFRQTSYLCSTLVAARWALGEIEWNKLLPICSIEWALSNLLNSAASWVVRHEGRYPTPQNPYSDCDYADFSCCEDESGKLQPECLQSMLLEDLDELVLLLDNYYVNLEYDEQSVVAAALTEFKRTLTYA